MYPSLLFHLQPILSFDRAIVINASASACTFVNETATKHEISRHYRTSTCLAAVKHISLNVPGGEKKKGRNPSRSSSKALRLRFRLRARATCVKFATRRACARTPTLSETRILDGSNEHVVLLHDATLCTRYHSSSSRGTRSQSARLLSRTRPPLIATIHRQLNLPSTVKTARRCLS